MNRQRSEGGDSEPKFLGNRMFSIPKKFLKVRFEPRRVALLFELKLLKVLTVEGESLLQKILLVYLWRGIKDEIVNP